MKKIRFEAWTPEKFNQMFSGSLVSFTTFSCKDVVHHPIETTDKQNGCSRRFVVYSHHPNVLHRTGKFTYMWGIKR